MTKESGDVYTAVDSLLVNGARGRTHRQNRLQAFVGKTCLTNRLRHVEQDLIMKHVARCIENIERKMFGTP